MTPELLVFALILLLLQRFSGLQCQSRTGISAIVSSSCQRVKYKCNLNLWTLTFIIDHTRLSRLPPVSGVSVKFFLNDEGRQTCWYRLIVNWSVQCCKIKNIGHIITRKMAHFWFKPEPAKSGNQNHLYSPWDRRGLFIIHTPNIGALDGSPVPKMVHDFRVCIIRGQFKRKVCTIYMSAHMY